MKDKRTIDNAAFFERIFGRSRSGLGAGGGGAAVCGESVCCLGLLGIATGGGCSGVAKEDEEPLERFDVIVCLEIERGEFAKRVVNIRVAC